MALHAVVSGGDKTAPFHRGDRLRKARECAGIQVQTMASLLDVERGTITRYEHDRGIRRWVVEAYARHTGFSYEWLQTGRGVPIVDPKLGISECYPRPAVTHLLELIESTCTTITTAA